MRSGAKVALAAVMILGACSTVRDSRVNPFNWFGPSKPAAAAPVTPGRPVVLDGGRILVAEVSELYVERATGGVIIRAKGVPPSQGWYQAQLVEESREGGELAYRFVLQPPEAGSRQGTPVSREVTVATFVNDFKMQGVQTVTVRGAESGRSVRQR